MFRFIIAAIALAAVSACPGSKSFIHAKAEVDVNILQTSCASVKEEIRSRVNGEKDWRDPHNGGKYSITSDAGDKMTLTRTTGDGKYTDKMDLAFTNNGGCHIQACSESQVTSILDYSTNFCNLHVLWCGSADNCPVVNQDFEYEEEKVDVSMGAGKDKKACIVKKSLLDSYVAQA